MAALKNVAGMVGIGVRVSDGAFQTLGLLPFHIYFPDL